MQEPVIGNKKIIRGWTMFDWANSAYSLVITSALFPIYFNAVTTTDTNKDITFLGKVFNSDSLQTYIISVAFLLIACFSPLLSSIADYSGNKKKFMFFFSTMGAIACSSLFFFKGTDTLYIGVLGSLLAAIGYSGSVVFYNSYLPEIAAPEDQDKISARGFSMGYIGSSLLLIFCLTMIMFPQWYGNIESGFATRLSFLLVGIWWFGFAQITFNRLPANLYNKKKEEGNVLTKGYRELRKVWSELKDTPRLKSFLLSFFLYNMGTQTVMYVATLFGTSELKLDSSILIVIILIIQFVGILGAWLFSRLSKRLGNVKALSIAITVWIFVCIGAYMCDKRFGVNEQNMFIGLAAVVGMVMGGVQALSRSTYSKLLPETTDHASYFSFYDVCDKIGTVLGTFIFGYINEITGSMRTSIIVLALFFIAGLISLAKVRQEKAIMAG
ncbi:MAG: MFS transporter [Bacteroidota bacterium]